MEIIRILKNCEQRKALVFGIGGGGDIVATIPTANFLRCFGFDVLHGSIVWDRLVVDPKPGPRSIEELENVEVFNDVIAIANENTRTYYGAIPTVARASKFFGRVIALDITKGAKKLSKGLKEFAEENEISLIVGIDSGGDAIAIGYESGVESPLADAMSIAALSDLNAIIGVFGFGSDGELKVEELLLNMSELLKRKCFLGCASMSEKDYNEMVEITKFVVTEASKIPIIAYEGEFGIKKIRESRTVIVSPLSTLTFYFTSKGVFEINKAAKIVKDAGNIEEANSLLNKSGILTELDYERAVAKD